MAYEIVSISCLLLQLPSYHGHKDVDKFSCNKPRWIENCHWIGDHTAKIWNMSDGSLITTPYLAIHLK